MQYALVSSTCKTTSRNMTLAVERDINQQIKFKFIDMAIFLGLCSLTEVKLSEKSAQVIFGSSLYP